MDNATFIMEQLLAENCRLRHACREARLALARAFGDTVEDEEEGGQPQRCPQPKPVNIFRKGK